MEKQFKNKKMLDYAKKNPKKAVIIKKAVKKGIKEYEEAFRRLASS